MKVAMYYNNTDVRIEDMDEPSIGPGELKIKVIASGVCGSDVMEWYRIKKAPLVLGHEIAGEIVEVGEGVSEYHVGEKVFVSHHVPCNTCHHCLGGHHTVCDTLRSTNFEPGGFAEYLRVPRLNVERGTFKILPEMTFDEGVFIEPLACVYRGMMNAGLKPGQSVLVIGSGVTGLLMIQLAHVMGASRVIASDVLESKLEAARKSGADRTLMAGELSASSLRDVNGGRLPDLVVVCTAAIPAIVRSFGLVERGGTLLLFAPAEPGIEVPIPMWDLWHNCVKIATSYGASPHDIKVAIALLASKSVKCADMISHRLPLDRAQEAFRLVAESRDSLKVVLYPHGVE